jgi:hypothetical protein
MVTSREPREVLALFVGDVIAPCAALALASTPGEGSGMPYGGGGIEMTR